MEIYIDIFLIFYQLPDNCRLLANYLERLMQELHTQIKKQLEFISDLTASTYSNYSTTEICLPLKLTKKSNKALQMDAQMMTANNFLDIGLLILI